MSRKSTRRVLTAPSAPDGPLLVGGMRSAAMVRKPHTNMSVPAVLKKLSTPFGTGLGCFRFQLVVLAVAIVLTPLSVAWKWPEWLSAALLFLVIVLLLVAGLLAGSLFAIATKETKLGLDLRGGVELVYQAEPTPQQPIVDQAALDRAIDVMRDRVDSLGVAEPEIQRSGENQISVGLPDVENAEQAQEQVGQVAQLFFYDWEPNVIGPNGRPDPQNPEVTGGQAAEKNLLEGLAPHQQTIASQQLRRLTAQ